VPPAGPLCPLPPVGSSPWGIPAAYRHMQGSGVNTYKWVNADGVGVLVKYHWVPKQGVKNLTQAEAERIQAKNFNHATQDLFDAIEPGDFPEWELAVQIMEDGEHPGIEYQAARHAHGLNGHAAILARLPVARYHRKTPGGPVHWAWS